MASDGTKRRNGIAVGLASIISVGFPHDTSPPPPPPPPSYLLLESNYFVLLEDTSKIELE